MTGNYPLRQFRISRAATLQEIIRCFPLATLISGNHQPPNVSLIPLIPEVVDDSLITLSGHLDINNPQAVDIVHGASISFVFHGPNTYASPDLYPHGHLPGWLYLAVQGYGTVSKVLDRNKTRAMLEKATEDFGTAEQEYRLADSATAVDTFIGGIRAFSIKSVRTSGIAKFAQDKGETCARSATTYLSGSVRSVAQKRLLHRILEETLGT